MDNGGRRATKILGAAASLCLVLAGCEDSLCSNDLFEELRSPDGQWSAVSFRRGCGATVAFMTGVSVQRPGEAPPKGRGNVFQIGTNSLNPGPQWVLLTWEGPARLVIRYGRGVQEIVRNEEHRGVAVDYRPE